MINRQVSEDQLRSLVRFLFKNGESVSLIRILKQTGRNKICWVHIDNGFFRRATFISFADLNIAFWRWLNQLKVMKLALGDRLNIANAVWELLSIGDRVYKREDNRLGVVVNKARKELDYPVLFVDWGDRLAVAEKPSLLEKF